MLRVSTLFTENADLAALSKQAEKLTLSQQKWNAVVPAALKPYTQAGNLNHNRLTVYANNGAVAAKIKLLLPSLIVGLQKQGLEITSIRVEVQVKSAQTQAHRKLRTLSPAAAASLEKLAADLQGSPLGDVIARLSSRR
ncbi:hypothetical protein SAMN05192560_0332 [Methylobacillus rhizosphaerae]|uniref:DUF721 domain-containing protein n=1 Tax=Methylobacillus rhizosphaerae TaxID=551994 RepID=A0A238Y2A1_9PROT|nr:DciA family protein [Methylobacillus rhizosphaerae]SNR64439.1 hypothetical protein SAMN05192560_0332 [Methylobacillus rhizosphaerae]